MQNMNYMVTIMQSHVPAGHQPIVVQAPLPETFNFDSNASYSQSLPQGPTSGAIADIAAVAGIRLAVPAMTAQLWQGASETVLTLALEFHTESDPVADVQTPILNLNRLTMPSVSSATGMLQTPGPYLDMSFAQITSMAGDIGTALANAGTNFKNGTVQPTAASMTKPGTALNGANNPVTQSNTQNPQLGSSQYWKSKANNQISIRIGNYMYFDSVVITNVQQTFMSNIDAATGLPHHATVNITFKPFFMLTQEDLSSVFINNQSKAGLPTTTNVGSSLGAAIKGPASFMPGLSAAYIPPQYRGIVQ
jgi:hypothetical protein